MGKTTFLSNPVQLIKSLILLFAFFVMGGDALAATYYSKASGNANQTATWGTNTDGSGTAPANFTTSGDTFIVRSGSTLSMNGNWTIGTGVELVFIGNLSVTNNNVDIQINGTVEFNGLSAAQVSLSGGGNGNDFTVAGTMRTANQFGFTGVANASVLDNSSGTVSLASTATAEFDGSAQVANGLPATFATLNANGTSLTLASAITVTNLNVNSGLVILGTHNLTTTNVTVTSPSATNMIVASGSGALRRIATAAGTYMFHVGDNTSGADYSPVSVTVTGSGIGSPDYIGVQVVDADHPSNSSVGDYLTRYWNITQSGITGAVVSATGTYVAGDVVGTESEIASARLIGTFNLTGNPWVKGAVADGDVTVTGASLASGSTMALTGISNENPTVSISGGNVSVCSGTNVALSTTATGDSNLTYSWSPATFLSSATSANPTVVNPTATTAYTLTVRDANGISVTASTTITVFANVTYYADADGDGFGNAAISQVSCTGAPEGYVANNTDCDDNNNAINSQFSFYVDGDNDGFGTGSFVLVCAVNAATPPAGYALNNTDCDDNDGSVNATFDFYVDQDGDGFGVGGLVQACAVNGSTPPAGYALNNTDCDDFNANAFALFNFYSDVDGDGYGSGDAVSVCASAANNPPAGYAVLGGDCNDVIATVNPGMSEVLYNGIDDNCNGTLDEGNQIISQVVASQCGSTLAAINSLIAAVSRPNSTGYRFEVTNTSTNAVQVIDRPLQWFALTMLQNYDYATTYSVRVMVQRNGVWLGYYGPACTISTPNVLAQGGAAQIQSLQCGSTLEAINSLIAASSIPNVTKYRFRVTNITDGTVANPVQVLDRNLHWFAMTMLPTYNYGTTYLVEVAIQTNGVFSQYGSPCTITTPEVPMLTVCGTQIPSSGTLVATINKSNTTSYRFEITNLETNQVTTLDRPYHWFKFNMFTFQPGVQYGIRVALMTSGGYSPFGNACVVTSPAAAREIDVKDDTSVVAFDAIAYPNPFAGSFNLAINGAEGQASVKVYDMTGRLLEAVQFNPANGEAVIGANYPSGVYTVIVEMAGNAETLRVIKR